MSTIQSESLTSLVPCKKRRHSKQVKGKKMKLVKDLAPFSTQYTFVKGRKGVAPPHLGGTRFEGHTSSCMQQMHERKTILKEVKNLSMALLSKHDKLAATLDRLKEEKRKQKKAKRLTAKKGDEIAFLKKRIGDLKRNEEMLLADLTAQ
jgi:hypothetical protein